MKITRSQLRRLIKEELDVGSTSKAPKIKSVNAPTEPNRHRFVVTLADGTRLKPPAVAMNWQVPEGKSHPSEWESSDARLSVKVDDTWYKYTKDSPDGVLDKERM